MSANGIVNTEDYFVLLAFLEVDLYVAGIVTLVIVCIAVHFLAGIDSVSLLFASLRFRC